MPESVPVGRECVSADGVKNGEARDGIMEEDIREGADAVHAIGGRGREREGAAGWLLWMWPLGNVPRIPSMSMRLAMAESGIGDISAAHYAREGRCNGGERGAAREAAMESLQGR